VSFAAAALCPVTCNENENDENNDDDDDNDDR
jgi:hypothetical protein